MNRAKNRTNQIMSAVWLLIVAFAVAFIIAGCTFEEDTIIYEGKELPISTVEEIIADKLEVENPDLDLEINIYEEEED